MGLGEHRPAAVAEALDDVHLPQRPSAVHLAPDDARHLLAELVDTEVYRAWVARYGVQYQWGRVLSSNAVSVPLDSVIFAVISFAGRLPASVVWSIIVANIVIKGLTAVASTPLIYTVKDRWVDRTPPT